MADPHNVEFEAAKFLQKLIHESTDEPSKLATKLYVILQHMKASGKENSMPYQVITRAMETVINQHGLDIEALMSSHLPVSSGSHVGESVRAQSAGCSQSVGGVTDSKSGAIENDSTRLDGFGSGRPPAAPNSVGNDPFQGSVSQRGAMAFDHESPSSMDTRSTNSLSQDRRDSLGWEQQGIQNDPKRVNIKRKRTDSSGMETPDDITQQFDSHSGIPDIRKERFTNKPETGVDSECWKPGLFKGATSYRERTVPGPLSSGMQVDASRNLTSASSLDAAGISHIPANADRPSQGGNPNNLCDVGIPGSLAFRDTGKFPAFPASVSYMPFKEHHLKQLRAQCLVFLAFRNGLSPKKLHLEIALGNMLPKEGTSSSVEGAQTDLIQDKGKQQTSFVSSSIPEVPLPLGNIAAVKSDGAPTVSSAAVNIREADLVSKGPENVKLVAGHTGSLAGPSHSDEEKKQLLDGHGIQEADTENSDIANCSALMTASLQCATLGMKNPATHIHEENLQVGAANHAAVLSGLNKQQRPEISRWSRVNHNDISRGMAASSQHDLGSSNENSSILSQRDSNIQNQQYGDSQMSTSWKSIQSIDSGHYRTRPVNDTHMLLRNGLHDGNGALENQTRSISDVSKVVPMPDSSYMFKDCGSLASMDKLSETEEGENSMSASLLPSPKYTLSEKWILAHQKKKIATEQKWVQKLQKADQRIATCFNELKETVSSSADISAKTRSVIELKKLQLLELQRCLRRNILNDFFKPIQTEMDRLKSIKKHRIGRRLKHVEKYEQKMKEERQKRIRERQKEFFSEIEVHKERLEDVFKYKRERCKSFNRHVKEYHKRKERIHREKIDRIQREKINLLKINDVEGYLRMVQDAKSDRVNKLLKETEKYLQKLGSRLKEAKAAARQVEMDDRAIIDDNSDIFTETEDENDQAKHYKESNEKYYLIAHSIKESIAEQPTGLRGGKLREYQMNGLRWLVSLYNNHLNGILADEMGLGKTVQVISLICYLMETKNDRGPFLVVVPSSVLPGWEHEMNFWAPGINKIIYAGPPEERRRLFKESIVHQKFNVLLTTYEYLMNKHDRPKLSKILWHYVIIDEGHRIKNASCKLNADLKHYNSSHRLLLTGTPLQNNLEELWALLNFLLPNIFNSSEDFSQWFNKPFEGNGDNSPDETLLSEEENLLIINRLHQVLRPFVLRRLKHKVENELPEKIERLIRCEASAYQKLLMKRVEENLGSLGVSKARAVHNSVMELRNICNHPYLSQLHAEEVDSFIPKHFLPPIVRLCGKLEMLDRLLPKLKETNHRVLFFSTMTRLLDVMEEYLVWKKYRYLRLDGHTSGLDRGALIDKFNHPDSPYFIFLLSIRAGGVGVNLQAADTVIIFDTDWNPQVDLQAQARAHRIGQKKDVLVLRLETVNTVEEQVRASAEHKLGVANQSITAGFFDNNTSAEDRREYLESLLRESKKEEAAPVLDDDSLNDILARSESEIDVFEAVDQRRREEEMAIWKRLVLEKGIDSSDIVPSLPSRLVTDDDLTAFYEAMKIYDVPNDESASSSGMKRKSGCLGGFDTQQYGRGKRAREVRSYEEQWTEEEFEKICQAESPETPKPKDEKISLAPDSSQTAVKLEPSLEIPIAPPPALELSPPVKKEVTLPVKRGRGRPRRAPADVSPAIGVSSTTIGVSKPGTQLRIGMDSSTVNSSVPDTLGTPVATKDASGDKCQVVSLTSQSSHAVPPSLPSIDSGVQSHPGNTPDGTQPKGQGRKGQLTEKNIDGNSGTEPIRRRGRKPGRVLSPISSGSRAQDSKPSEKPQEQLSADMAVSTTPQISSSNPLADSVSASHPNSSEGCAGIAVDDSKESTLAIKQSSSDVPVQESPVVQDPKTYAQATKPSILDSSSVALVSLEASSVSKVDTVSQDQVVSFSESSSVAPTVGALPSKSVTEIHQATLQTANPSSESELPSPIGLRPGRRQSQKPQSVIEPVRGRGRKRGRIASTDLTSLDVQDKNVIETGKNTGSSSTPTNKCAVTPSAPANVEIDPRLSTGPVISLVPVPGFMPGATPLTDNGGSVQHVIMGLESSIPVTSQPSLLSGTPVMSPEVPKLAAPLPPQGKDQGVQAGETAPRRRGRKKSTASPVDSLAGKNLSSRQSNRNTGEFVERKVIATRSRQINIIETKSSQDEANACDTFTPPISKTSEAIQSSKPRFHGVSQPNLGSASVVADGTSKSPESRLANPRENTEIVCRGPVEIPPVSCKGKTNVIVLALELTTRDVDPTGTTSSNADGKKECLKLQKDSTQDVLAPAARFSGLKVTSASEIQAPNQDEELSAPPGFDTPRPGVSNAAGRKSFEVDNCGTSKISDAKRGSVVLALESTTQTINSCKMACDKVPKERDSAEAVRVKGSEMIVPPLEATKCQPGSVSADKIVNQSEEEMSAPPGFDIPQRCLSDNAVELSLEGVHGMSSDMQADRENSQGPHDDNLENFAVSTASSAVGLNIVSASTLESSSQKDEHSNGIGDSDTVKSLSLELKVENITQGLDDNNDQIEHVVDAAPSSDVAGSHADIISASESKDEVGCHEPSNEKPRHGVADAPATVCILRSDTSTPLDSELRGELHGGYPKSDIATAGPLITEGKESHGIEDGCAAKDVDAPAVSLLVSGTAVASNLESEEKENSHRSEDGCAEKDVDAPAISLLVSGTAVATHLELEEKENSHRSEDGCAEKDVNAPEVSLLVSGTAVASPLESEEKENPHMPEDGCSRNDVDENPLTSLAIGSDTAVISTLKVQENELHSSSRLESKEKEESHDVDNANAENGGGVRVVFDTLASSLELESKEKKQCHEPVNANAQNDSNSLEFEEKEECLELGNVNANAENDTNSMVMETIASSSVEIKDKEELLEPSKVNPNAKDDTNSMVMDTVAFSSLEFKEKEECLEPGNLNANAENDTNSMVMDNVASSSLEFKETEECLEPGNVNANAENDTNNMAMDTVASSSLEFKEKEKCLASSSSESKEKEDCLDSSSWDLKEKEECLELDNSNSGKDTDTVVSDAMASSSLESNEKEMFHVSVDGGAENEDSNALSASLAVNCDTAVTFSLESKEKEELHGLNDGNAGLVATPTTSCNISSDNPPVLIEDFKNKEECPGPEDSGIEVNAVERDALDASPSCIVASDNQAASTMEAKEKQECHNGPDSGDDKREVPGAYTSPLVNSDIVTISYLGLKETEECHGSSSTADSDATKVVDSETMAASSSEFKKEGDGLDDGTTEQDGGDATAASCVGTD